ncbi:LacI family DNA-binding transcriptional regulator [Armatimonas rosea]|uniref:LacI family transcriptional regulator n=1 Tax=Armatimonas rosea TaxID=685828 RepID=A0A7W9SUR5_ARMRO|nr:LacI family DNA-binding transcriptional regulator [Armatimonas rosea]MBB6052733.1 LacI family transcriptional regulator [Armatimonas rosea]
MRRFRKATIKEVAQQAGVSVTTVSLFVGGRESVCSPETAERIRRAVEALNYTPSSLVSSVQRRATRTFGVCMLSPLDPELDFGGHFYEQLWRGIVAEADAIDYSLLHFPASVRCGASTDAFLDGRVDGVLYHANTHSDPNQRPTRLASAGLPTVLLTRSQELPEGCGTVYTDEATTAALALEHLWELGHRRIGHLAGPRASGDDGIVGEIGLGRLRGYRQWLQAHDAYDPALEGFNGSWQDRCVAELLQHWSTQPSRPTALFCANDTLALAALAHARALGWPLSVVGVDNAHASAGLTSVDPGGEAIGRESVRSLLRLIEGAPVAQCRVAVPALQLHIRASTAPV